MTDIAKVVEALTSAEVARRGYHSIDWPAVNATQAALRVIGLRDALAGELALWLWLEGKPLEIIATEPTGGTPDDRA